MSAKLNYADRFGLLVKLSVLRTIRHFKLSRTANQAFWTGIREDSGRGDGIVGAAELRPWRTIENDFSLGIPIDFLTGPVGARGHHARHGMRKSIVHRGLRLLPTAQTI